MERFIKILILLFVAQTLVFAKTNYVFNTFKYNEDKTYVEFSYSLNAKDLNYRYVDSLNAYVSNIELSLDIDAIGVKANSFEWTFKHVSKVKNPDLLLFDKYSFYLYPGQYEYRLDIQNSDKTLGNYKGKLLVEDYSERVRISDIELAYTVRNKSEDEVWPNKFLRKNSFYLIPNTSSDITDTVDYARFYYEVYNLNSYLNKSLNVIIELKNGINKTVFRTVKTKKINTENISDLGVVALDSIPNGLYKIIISVEKNKSNITLKSKKIYLLKPGNNFKLEANFIENLSFEKSPFSIMTDSRIETEFDKAKPILTEYEREEFQRLTTLRARQRAMYKYWNSRDPDTTTVQNEFLTEYEKRVQFAETYFARRAGENGWDTDRGYVLLKYGFPTDRQRYESRESKNAAEEWFYAEMMGGVWFFFVDKYGDQRFLLVHSNMPGEIKNWNWFQDYNPAIENDGSPRYNSNRLDDGGRR